MTFDLFSMLVHLEASQIIFEDQDLRLKFKVTRGKMVARKVGATSIEPCEVLSLSYSELLEIQQP